MIATDPLSLVFLGCFVFAGLFLLISTVTNSGHGHALHFGGHGLQLDHAGHIAHDAHAGHDAHAAHAGTSGGAAGAGGVPGFFDSVLGTLEEALSVYGILTFLLVFGLLGYLLHNSTNVGVVLTLLLALLVALACAVGVSATLTRLFVRNESHGLTRESSRLEGRLGQVSMAIRAGGVGEVIFKGETGARQSLGARGVDGQPIPAGVDVVILASSDGMATVQPWESFIASVRAGAPPQLAPLEMPQ
jgi:membrane protein implicated in regulation of membrane protease activity